MVLSFSEDAKKLWELWNVRGFVMLSLLVQVFLILFAPLRKWRRGKWGVLEILTWTAYLLADWIAGVAIGSILANQIKSPGENSDIQALWAPFLLLHLGGPDTITSFALEDNEFWVRHLLGLALQIASTVYVFLISLPNNHLWPSTVLVLIAGIIKYGERSRAFYLASFEQLGENWVPSEWGDELPIPAEFLKVDEPTFEKTAFDVAHRNKSILWYAVHHFGTIKMLLVGPFLSREQCVGIRETFRLRSSSEVLRIMEIELSLLYEVLHTKLPVVGCRIGYILRGISMGCALVGLALFSYTKKHYQLGIFDIVLTYALLAGSLMLDLIAIMQLFFSDWNLIALLQNLNSYPLRDSISKWIDSPRWSAKVSQLNFITYYVKDHQGLWKVVYGCLLIPRLRKALKRSRCLSSQKFIERQEWDFIFYEVKALNDHLNHYLSSKLDSSRSALEAKEVWQYSRDRALERLKISNQLVKIIKEFDYTKSVLIWHIATELCLQEHPAGSIDIGRRKTAENTDHEALCKLFSDYMFYLMIMQPAMMAAVAVTWKTVLKNTLEGTKLVFGRCSISGENEAALKILKLRPSHSHPERDINRSVLYAASALAKELLKHSDGCPWGLMCNVWVQLMCFAAINCRPQVHAQQPSKGGELLTFIWLLMNHVGLGTHFSSHF